MTREYLETQAFIARMELFMWAWWACFALAVICTTWFIFGFKERDDE